MCISKSHVGIEVSCVYRMCPLATRRRCTGPEPIGTLRQHRRQHRGGRQGSLFVQTYLDTVFVPLLRSRVAREKLLESMASGGGG
eukprot:g60512.t1